MSEPIATPTWKCTRCGTVGPSNDSVWKWDGRYWHGCLIGVDGFAVWQKCDPSDNRFDETRRLLIEMRKYVVHHGILIGECVAWSKLKVLYGIVNEGMEVSLG